LSEAVPSCFKILEETDGNTRFKITYDRAWATCEAVVVKTSYHKLLLVDDDPLKGEDI